MTNKWRTPFIIVVLLLLCAASSRSSDAGPTTERSFESHAEVRQQGAVTVRAAVLTDDESEQYFGGIGWLTMASRSFG